MSKTSWKVKERYNQKAYGRIYCLLPKDLVEQFKARCREIGVSQQSIVKDAIERFLGE